MGYDQFRVVDASKIHEKFASHEITTLAGMKTYHEFKLNSSGPFGEDLPSEWQDKNAAFASFFSLGTSWRDIQAKDTRAIYIEDARKQGLADPESAVAEAYAYWTLYPDVANDSKYGKFGFDGARHHYDKYGRDEKREWNK
jgi:hypothetical protein